MNNSYNIRDVQSIYLGTIPILSIYKGSQLLWPMSPIIDKILSCYYNGYWIDDYPWTDDTSWTD